MIKANINGTITITPTRGVVSRVVKKNKYAEVLLHNLTALRNSPISSCKQVQTALAKYRTEIKPTKKINANNITHNGTVLSSSAKARIRNLCTSLYHSRSNLKFLTLSLPSARQVFGGCEVFASDSFYVNCLSKFLENLKVNYGLVNYLWVAERQMKYNRGAIHYHLVVDIPFQKYTKLSEIWSNLLLEYHYSSVACVDGVTINSLNGVSSYLSSYLSKKTSKKISHLHFDSDGNPVMIQKEPSIEPRFYCRVWAMSREWSQLSRSEKCVKELNVEQLHEVLEDESNVYKKNEYKLKNTQYSITIIRCNQHRIFELFFKDYYDIPIVGNGTRPNRAIKTKKQYEFN
jgi:hypothetical protein